MRTPQRCGGA